MSFSRRGFIALVLLYITYSQTVWADAVSAYVGQYSGQPIDIILKLGAYDSVSIDSQNAGATITVDTSTPGADGTVIFTYTAPSGYVGADAFTYSATAGANTTSATVTILVTPLQTPSDPASIIMLNQVEKMCSSGTGNQAPASLVSFCQEISSANAQELAALLRQLAPLELGGQMQLSNSMATQQLDNVRKRLASLRLGIAGESSISQLYLNSAGKDYAMSDILDRKASGGAASADGQSILGIYASGRFGAGSHDESAYEDGYDTNSRGITAGADYRITDKFVAGVAIGNNQSAMDISQSGGSVDIGGYSLMAYSSYYVTSKTYVEAIWAVHKNALDSSRNINYSIANVSRSATATSSTDNGIASISVGTGYEAYFSRGLTINLAANLDVLKSAFDGYVESGAGDKNLVVDKRENTTTIYSLNSQFTYAISFPGGVLIPQVDFNWKHEFQDKPIDLRAYYRVDPNRSRFTISTEVPDTDYFQLNLGASYIVPGGNTGYIYYEKTLGKTGYSQYNVNLGLRIPI